MFRRPRRDGALVGDHRGRCPRLISKVAPRQILMEMSPGDCAYFEGDERDPWHFNDGSSWPSEGVSGISTRHFQGATLASMDGSASYVHDHDWLEDVNFTNKNRLWCYPKTANGGDPVYGHVMLNN